MLVGIVLIVLNVAALSVLLTAPGLAGDGLLGGIACTAAENLPCRPLTLECLFAAGGALPASYAATTPLPPWLGGDSPYDQGSNQPDRTPRQYAPDPPPGYQPPAQRDPAEALNNEEFRRTKEDWARENADRFPTIREETAGGNAFDVLVQSIQNKDQRR